MNIREKISEIIEKDLHPIPNEKRNCTHKYGCTGSAAARIIPLFCMNTSQTKRLQPLPKEERKNSLAATGECYCTKLFQLEESFADLTPEERHTKQLELEKPILDAL